MQTQADYDTTQLRANSHLTFEDQVLEKIAGICAQAIDGILGMDGNVVDSLAETFTKDERVTKGISAEVGETQVALNLNVILAYDADAQAIFDTLCDRTSRAIQQMTGLQLVELNLHVRDIMTRREWQKAN
jgi:uncharacterized alkaline shock family protein YloU